MWSVVDSHLFSLSVFGFSFGHFFIVSGENKRLVVVIGLVPWDDYAVTQLEMFRDCCIKNAVTLNFVLVMIILKA